MTRATSLRALARPLLLVVALAVIAHANALRNGFVLDDIPIIVENPIVRDLGNVRTIFQTDYWSLGGTRTVGDSTLYRPLTILSYAADYAVWDLNATAFHAMNVVVHAATTALVFVVALQVLGGVLAAFAAASIFAVHPVHTEAVTGVVGRAELLATLFFVGAFLVLRRRSAFRFGDTAGASPGRALARVAGGASLYLLGLFSKESAVTLPAVLAVDDWLRRDELPRDRRSAVIVLASRYAALAIAAVVYFAFREQALTGGGRIWPGFLGVSAGDRVLTASRVLLEYLGLFVFPRHLLPDYWKSNVPIATSLADPLVIVSFVLWIACAVLVVRSVRRDGPLVLSIAWFFITIAPVSNVLFPIGVGKAERLLYLPSVGLCLLCGWAYARAETIVRPKWAPRAALAAVVIAFTARTVVRNEDWRNSFTLASASLAASPSSPLMNDIIAGELVRRGEAQRAVAHLQEAVRQDPDMALLRTHLGATYHSLGQLDRAIAEYQEAIRRNPLDAEAHNNLGVAYRATNREEAAIAEFNEAIRIHSKYADPHINLGAVHLSHGRLNEALAEFTAAVQASPTSAEAHYRLGLVHSRSGQLDRAARAFREALRLNPAHADAAVDLARVDSTRGARQ